MHKHFIVVPLIQQWERIAFSALSLVLEALLLPGFGQVALNDIHIHCHVASTQEKWTNYSPVLDIQRCWKECAEEFQRRLCPVSSFADLCTPVRPLLRLGFSIGSCHGELPHLDFTGFSHVSFSLHSGGHCSIEISFPTLVASWLSYSVSDFSRF